MSDGELRKREMSQDELDRVVPPHCAALVFEHRSDGEMTMTLLLAEGTSGRLLTDGDAPIASQMAMLALGAARKAISAATMDCEDDV